MKISEILDVGCGQKKEGTVNIDIDRNVKPDVLCDMLFFPFRKGSFRKVILTWVVEHTTKPDQLISGCYEVLEPSGIIDVGFPNVASFTVLLDWLRKNLTYSESLILGDPSKPYLTHKGLFTVPKVERLLLAHGFRIEKVVGHPPSVGSRLLRSIGYVLVRLFPQRAGTITVTARKEGIKF